MNHACEKMADSEAYRTKIYPVNICDDHCGLRCGKNANRAKHS